MSPNRHCRLVMHCLPNFPSLSRLGCFACLLVATAASQGQAAAPSLTGVYPTACSKGEAVEVTIEGKGFEQGGRLFFSRRGLTAEHIEKNRFRVSAAADAPLGDGEVWIATAEGLAGPRRFSVVSPPVVNETEQGPEGQDNDDHARAQGVRVPSVVEARLDKAGDLDWFEFNVEQNEPLVVAAKSVSLDGGVHPVLTICDDRGRELAFSEASDLEPVLCFTPPSSGRYRLGVHDRAYAKDQANQYRLEITVGSRTLSVFPHAISAEHPPSELEVIRIGSEDESQAATFPTDLLGLMDSEDAEITARSAAALPHSMLTFRRGGQPGSARLGISPEPVVVERGDSTGSNPQAIQTPCRVAGRFLQRGEVDWYRVEMTKNSALRIESFGERLGQLMDLDVSLCDAEGKLLQAAADIVAVKGVPDSVPTQSLDAAIDWKAPADGEYLIAIRDLYGGSVFGPDRSYELAVAPPAPAFAVFATSPQPSLGVTLKRGESATLPLVALRSGGFQGPISIYDAARDGKAPESMDVAVDAAVIDSKKSTYSLKLSASAEAELGFHTVRLVAEAKLGSDKEAAVVRSAVRGAAQIRAGVARRIQQVVVYVHE